MNFVRVTRDGTQATIILSRGKVNAIEETVVGELSMVMSDLARDNAVTSVVLTGQGKFFSFGFDVPELYDRSPEQMGKFVRSFCRLSREIFLFPKAIVAAVNGHAVAGGCILALACDYRVLASEGAKMALNEVTFGASLFSSAVEMVRFATGNRNAQQVLLTGAMFGGEEALGLGLADEMTAAADVQSRAEVKARELAGTFSPAYVSLKNLLKRPVADAWMLQEDRSIREWLDVWYSPSTREKIKEIQIR